MSDALTPFIETDPLYENPIIQQQLGKQIPWLKICYPGSDDKPNGAQPGDLYLNSTGQIFDVVEVVLLGMVPTYRWLEGKWTNERLVSCWSADCMVPVGTGINPQPGPCNEVIDGKIVPVCPKKKWDRTNPDKPTPPECGDDWFHALWDLKNERGMVFTSKNAGNDAFKYLLKQIQLRARDLSPDGKIPPRFRCRFHMTTVPKESYFVPRIDIRWESPVTDEELAKCSEFMGTVREDLKRLAVPFFPRSGDSYEEVPF